MEVVETGQYAPYVRDRLDFYGARPKLPPEEWDPPCLRFPHHPARRAYREDVVAAMDANRIDALLYPTWTSPPAQLERAREEYRGDNSQVVAPSTGLPALTVPMGETQGGLPAGLQMLGRPFSEGRLIALAYSYEQATHHRRPPERFPELSEENRPPIRDTSLRLPQARGRELRPRRPPPSQLDDGSRGRGPHSPLVGAMAR
jgi:hypothetical protein